MLLDDNYNMLVELDRLEKLMPKYKVHLRKLSLLIRNKIWKQSEEMKLANTLAVLNRVFKISIDVTLEDIDYIFLYIELLLKYSENYSQNDLSNEYIEIQNEMHFIEIENIIKTQWKQINPYFKDTYNKDEMYEKNIIEIFDDFFSNCIMEYPQLFLKDLREITNMCRARKGIWIDKEDLLPPSIEIAIEKNIINRWNPPIKRYLYLSASDCNPKYYKNIMLNELVCLKEMRAKKDDVFTLCNFEMNNNYNNLKIIDLSFNDIIRDDIECIINKYKTETVKNIVGEMIHKELGCDDKIIIKMIEEKRSEMIKIVAEYTGKFFLKELCDAIFVPLDENEDNDKVMKDKCYRSFHILSEYLEKKEINGILYPSTMAKTEDVIGKNLVLFNVESVQPILNSFKVIKYTNLLY